MKTVEQSKILSMLSGYNCPCDVVEVIRGAMFTDFVLLPQNGTTLNKLKARQKDFSLCLGVSATIETQNNTLILRIANKDRHFYNLLDYIGNIKESGQIAIGVNAGGEIVIDNLFKMPHLLVAGATGGGKSVFVHNCIVSLGYGNNAFFRLIDLKRVELSIYNGYKKMISNTITTAEKAEKVLKDEVNAMQCRYKLMERQRVRNYKELKKPLAARVIVIDELADLMLNKATRKSVENSIVRIAQLGRAAGCHLILATQRPSREVITGLIKANIPARVAFTTSSAIDSKVIGVSGAELLRGKGEAIYTAVNHEPERIQSFYLSDEQLEYITQRLTKRKFLKGLLR